VAAKYRMTILLKGAPSIVVDPSGEAVILPFGNSALAKAGTGDVLSGIMVSLMAQGMPITQAAILGSYLHGEAGVLASRTLGEYSVIAGDVVEKIPLVMKNLSEA
jgi:NAD(P)H-hydrate repair Nnr-like enzyme with NAD(P)H-hydrate dehydratase domain